MTTPRDPMTARDRFLAACRRDPVDRPPVWIMRQAGRYMSSYRALRERANFLEICRRPELSLEATMMAVDQLEVDAAILFSDILIPLAPMGLSVDFDEGGPKVSTVRDMAAIDKLSTTVTGELGYVADAVSLIRKTLDSRPDPLPLLGFSGSPFTLATYAIEGGTTKNKHALRRMVWDHPDALHALLDKMATVVGPYCSMQVDAGVHAIQLFDTWGGLLTEDEWRRFSLPYTQRVIKHLRQAHPHLPIIHYALDATHLMPGLADLQCEVLSVDHKEPLSLIREKTGRRFAFQGNVEPGVMTASTNAIARAVENCIDDYGAHPGHIVNLGHGITPDARVEAAQTFVRVAKEHGAALWSA
jgi:uroporphyrinogen decarboxylase